MSHTAGRAPRVAVVGAGLGGMSAAIRLAAAGYAVTVFEKQAGPGGKAFSNDLGAYRFDTGPSLFTLRHVFEQLFEEAGRTLEDYLGLIPLERICNYFWRGGERMSSYADRDRFAAEFERLFGEDPVLLETIAGELEDRFAEVPGVLGIKRAGQPPPNELALVLDRSGRIVGYTAGNDVSSRSIEGENPLYLPQAKVYNGSCALGPGIVLAHPDEMRDLQVGLVIERGGAPVFEGETRTSQLKRSLEEIAKWLFADLDFPGGACLMTGTGIVPPDDFTLAPGDAVRISVGDLVLENEVE